jgi:Tol biopolymer transport system component
LATGAVHEVAKRPAGTRELPYFSVISPDSSAIAYAWRNSEDFYEIRVSSMPPGASSAPRVLFRDEEIRFVQPCAWTPDGKQILTLFFRTDNISQIALLPADGGRPKVLRSLNWVYPKKMDVSPDGRYIVYDSFAPGSSTERTLFILSIDGASEKRVVHTPGDHLFPLWTPDGKHIVFLREERGAMNAWKLRIENGAPAGQPVLWRANLGRALPLGVTSGGQYFVGVNQTQSDLVEGLEARPLDTAFPARNFAPSLHGKRLAYLSRRGIENFGEAPSAIIIRDHAGKETELSQVDLPVMESLRWSPDGKRLLVSGMDGKGRAGAFVVDVADGALRAVASESGTGLRGFPADWCGPRRSQVCYLHQGEEVRLGERTVARGKGLHSLTVRDDGSLAYAATDSVHILELETKRSQTIQAKVRQLHWCGHDLLALTENGKLRKLPLHSGNAIDYELKGGGAVTGFSIDCVPDGSRWTRAVFAISRVHAEVRALPLQP